MHIRLPASYRILIVFAYAALLGACASAGLAARASVPLVNAGAESMNRETDPTLAREAIPSQLEMIDTLVAQLPDNANLRLRAAQGFYSYAFGFVENRSRAQASALYHRAFENARVALALSGFSGDLDTMNDRQLRQTLQGLNRRAVPAMFWTASCLAKWIDMNRDHPALLADMSKAVLLMRRVETLDGRYYFGGPYLFFGVYYGSRPPMFGGNPERARKEFAKAWAVTHGKLLLVDVLKARYLERQTRNRMAFHKLLTEVRDAPPNLFPQMALANAIAKQMAKRLLSQEEELF